MMLGNGYGTMNWFGGVWIFGILIWVLLVTFLVLGIAYFWKGLNEKKRK